MEDFHCLPWKILLSNVICCTNISHVFSRFEDITLEKLKNSASTRETSSITPEEKVWVNKILSTKNQISHFKMRANQDCSSIHYDSKKFELLCPPF